MTTTIPPTDRHTIFMPIAHKPGNPDQPPQDHPFETALLALIINHPAQQPYAHCHIQKRNRFMALP